MSMFSVMDSQGRYVDKYSIWYEKETDRWHYTNKGCYKIDCSMKNLDTGVILSKTEKEAQKVIEMLKRNLHKVNIQTDFIIVKIN